MQRIARPSLSDEAYRELRRAIVAGDLAPGQVIRDAEIAAQVGLSRTPVREALTRLALEGLVESKPHAYTRVTPLLRREVEDAYVVLRTLHELAAREAARRISADDLAAMREANSQFAAALRAGDVQAAMAADDDLHGTAITAAGNRALAQAVERLTPLIRRLETLRFASVPGRRSVDMHERIIAALEAHDADTAAALTAENWSTLGEQIAKAFE